ncbi:MAG TPA: hybrid sensor histidine kinase/response regulator [Cyanobacteria bacterium UBA12227]|nr:hybrid sensor histidine kinase/response regulator [Cyanobacteria bacterium UBA12227]HAX87764.1 hybrid sensor histidine kinase/response regulator [Cyanobacteria bacterium UBA11370]HBY75864.1 hybrid sensor histidine kinase/response regulator [Cyanobacteria bacterium UBA11148]
MGVAKILIVEDETITAQAIAAQIKRLGYEVADIVNSGQAALAKVAENRPDLVLMDIVLKQREMDGIEAAAQMRSHFKIPVIYLTAHTEETILSRAKVTEPFGYIVKPFNQRDLRIAIEIGLYRHRMEQQLIEREKLLSTILDSTSDAVIATDEIGCITYMNPMAETLTGWQSFEALGKSITEVVQIIDERNNTAVENPVMQVLRGETLNYLGNYRTLITKSGTRIPIAGRTSPMEREGDTIKGAVFIFEDNTERRKAEVLELEQGRLSPEITKQEKTESEGCEGLETQQEINHFTSRIMSMIAHEYRTPLAVILTSTGLLKRYGSELPKEKKEMYLERIQTGVKQMDRLLDKVVIFNKAEANELKFNPEPLDVAQWCNQLVEEQRLLVGDRYTIHFATQGSIPSANLDKELVGHIVTNLLANGIKYSAKGSIISLVLIGQENEIVLKVQDSGIGIPQAEQEKIFLPFVRASNVSTISGTGIGLSIVKKCVDLHGGQIAIASEIGVGTTVTVTLPIKLIR